MMKRCKPIKYEAGRFLSNGQSAKRGLNRSITDARWYSLTQKLEYLAASVREEALSRKLGLKPCPSRTALIS